MTNTESSTVIVAACFYKIEKGNLIVMGIKLTTKALLFYKKKIANVLKISDLRIEINKNHTF